VHIKNRTTRKGGANVLRFSGSIPQDRITGSISYSVWCPCGAPLKRAKLTDKLYCRVCDTCYPIDELPDNIKYIIGKAYNDDVWGELI
jgi:uncharacterized protein YbaR (Trm112 family)